MLSSKIFNIAKASAFFVGLIFYSCSQDTKALIKQREEHPVTILPKTLHQKELNYVPVGVFMGNTGSGKTTILNLICNTKHSAKGTGVSVTRDLFCEPSEHGSKPFFLVDTPGIDSNEEVYKHAYLLKSALEAKPYNAVFFITPYESINREGRALSIILDQAKFVLDKYRSNLVLMVSKCDTLDKDERADAEVHVSNIIKETGVGLAIMYSKRSNPVDLSNAMYACMSNLPKIKIEVTDEDFFKKFKIWDAQKDMAKSYTDFKTKSQNLLKEHLDLVQQSHKENDMDVNNMIQAFSINLNDEIDELIQKFEKDHGFIMIEFNSYTAHIEMKKHKIEIMDKFLDMTRPLMSWDMSDLNDIRNQIKKCIYCGEFLIKTQGCDKDTICGNVPHNYDIGKDDQSQGKKWYKNVIKRISGVLNISKEGVSSKSFTCSYSNVDKFLKKDLKPGSVLGLGGCGNTIAWGTLPCLDPYTLDYIMKELKSTESQAKKNLDEESTKKAKPKSDLDEMGVSQINFDSERKKYESEIDTKMKSAKK